MGKLYRVIHIIENADAATTGIRDKYYVIGDGSSPPFMDNDKAKYEITIHNPWTDTTIHTFDIQVASAHMIYKSHRPPSSHHDSITLSIGGIKYNVCPRAFPHPTLVDHSIDDLLQEIMNEIIYCLDLHDALYIE